EVARMFEFLVPLRPPPRHLLYVCRLTTACQHPELSYDIKDRDMNGFKVEKKGAKNNESIQSGFEATLSATTIHQASLEAGKNPAAATAEIATDTPRTAKVIINLSGNTRASCNTPKSGWQRNIEYMRELHHRSIAQSDPQCILASRALLT
nr:hypothetical protein [Tanacetum cinerariifolium]